MKTKLLLLCAALVTAGTLSSCIAPYGGYGYGYNNYYPGYYGLGGLYGGIGYNNYYYNRPGYAYSGYRGLNYGRPGFTGYRPGFSSYRPGFGGSSFAGTHGGFAHTGGFSGGGFHGGGFGHHR